MAEIQVKTVETGAYVPPVKEEGPNPYTDAVAQALAVEVEPPAKQSLTIVVDTEKEKRAHKLLIQRAAIQAGRSAREADQTEEDGKLRVVFTFGPKRKPREAASAEVAEDAPKPGKVKTVAATESA